MTGPFPPGDDPDADLVAAFVVLFATTGAMGLLGFLLLCVRWIEGE